MEQRLSLVAFLGLLLIAGCGDDPSPDVCRPIALQVGNDSIAFSYNGKGKIDVISYHDVLGHKSKQNDITYNSDGRPVTIITTIFPLSANAFVDVEYRLTYDEQGRPKNLEALPFFGDPINTEFTHDDQNRLIEASTSSDGNFVGSTRYEYDEKGNIPKVFYTLNLNQRIQEVLARENLTFDDTEKFYANVPELKICNEYVFAYLPNKNNCLTATVYYYSYLQRFANPLSVEFQASYNERGLINSLESNSATQLYSGDVLFEAIIYHCN